MHLAINHICPLIEAGQLAHLKKQRDFESAELTTRYVFVLPVGSSVQMS
jgi:hypothetical protein